MQKREEKQQTFKFSNNTIKLHSSMSEDSKVITSCRLDTKTVIQETETKKKFSSSELNRSSSYGNKIHEAKMKFLGSDFNSVKNYEQNSTSTSKSSTNTASNLNNLNNYPGIGLKSNVLPKPYHKGITRIENDGHSNDEQETVKKRSSPSFTSKVWSNINRFSNPGTNKPNKKKLKPGQLYIFNLEHFKDNDHTRRTGSENDVNSLQKAFKKFNVESKVYRNSEVTVERTKAIMTDISKKNFSENSCIAVVFMTHGKEDSKIFAFDGELSVHRDIIKPLLQNKHLNNKPKIIIIEACKGKTNPVYETDSNDHKAGCILLFESTYEGYVAYRPPTGAIFIQSFCDILSDYGSFKSIQEICEQVKISVKKEIPQCPFLSGTLTDRYCFGDYAS